MPLLFISENILEAICRTLLHSLWQGLALAIIAGLVILCTKKAVVQLRYNLLLGAFVLFIAVACSTFFIELKRARNTQSEAGIEMVGRLEMTGATDILPAPLAVPNYFEQAIQFCNRHEGLIVSIWFCILLLQMAKLLLGIRHVQRLRNNNTFQPDGFWKEKLAKLVSELKLNPHIMLLESELVKAPMVIGWLKPVILMPIGFMAQLPQSQVELILLHELAHIKRKDYVVNFFQHIGEIVFFFNPAVLWVSQLLRDEREACCDHMAVGKTVENKKAYLEALIYFQENSLKVPVLAHAFPGTKNHLLNRVKRIINGQNKSLDAMEQIFLVATLLIISVFTLSFLQKKETEEASKKAESGYTVPQKRIQPRGAASVRSTPVADTVPQVRDVQVLTNGDKRTFTMDNYKVVTENYQLKQLYINGQLVADKDLAQYRSLTDAIIQKAKNDIAAYERNPYNGGYTPYQPSQREAVPGRTQGINELKPNTQERTSTYSDTAKQSSILPYKPATGTYQLSQTTPYKPYRAVTAEELEAIRIRDNRDN
jgi:bla regulator protein BlaR1